MTLIFPWHRLQLLYFSCHNNTRERWHMLTWIMRLCICLAFCFLEFVRWLISAQRFDQIGEQSQLPYRGYFRLSWNYAKLNFSMHKHPKSQSLTVLPPRGQVYCSCGGECPKVLWLTQRGLDVSASTRRALEASAHTVHLCTVTSWGNVCSVYLREASRFRKIDFHWMK